MTIQTERFDTPVWCPMDNLNLLHKLLYRTKVLNRNLLITDHSIFVSSKALLVFLRIVAYTEGHEKFFFFHEL